MATKYNTRDFHWDDDSGEFTAFASDVGFRPERTITLVSHKTGTEKVCVLEQTKTDADNDYQWWAYRAVSVGTPFTVRFFND